MPHKVRRLSTRARPSRSGPSAPQCERAPPMVRERAAHTQVTPTPIMGTAFTFERALANQCKSSPMPVTFGSQEYTHFIPAVAAGIRYADTAFNKGATNQVLRAWVKESAVWEEQMADLDGPDIHSLRFTQLVRSKTNAAAQNTTGKYEPFDGGVLGPDSVLYELKSPPYSKCTFELVVRAENFPIDENGQPCPYDPKAAVKVSVGKYKRDEKMLGTKERNSTVMYVEFGQILANAFTPWDPQFYTMRFCMDLDPTFTIETWKPRQARKRPLTPPPPTPAESEPPTVEYEQGIPMFDDENTPDGTQHFMTIDGCLHMSAKKEKDRPIKLANFSVDKLERVMHPEEEDAEPIYVIKITYESKGGDEELFASLNEPAPKITVKTRTCTVEVGVELGKLQSMPQMRSLFLTRGHCFFVEAKFTPTVLSKLIGRFQEETKYDTTKLITTFGHVKDGIYLMGNIAFQDSNLLDLQTLGYTVSLGHFVGDKRRKLNLSYNDVPQVKIVHEPWVRFKFFYDMWRTTFPEQFLNNELPAKATLAVAVMHLQYSNLQNHGPFGQPMCPGALLHGEKGTGKTAAMSCAQAFIGKKNVQAKLGAELSLPLLTASLSLQSNLTYVIDEVATHQSLKNEQGARMYKNLVHMCYDGTTRGVMATESSTGSTPIRTSFIATANIVPLHYDPPAVERVLHIHFKPLEGGHTDGAKMRDHSTAWTATLDMISCLMPDFAALVYDGKLDRSAILDCCSYMNAVCGVSYQRLCNMWGFLLYYMLLLEYISLGDEQSTERIFEWATFECYKQYKLVAKNSTILLKFLKAVKLLYNQQQKTNDMEKVLFHHNVRMMPGDDNWIAVRLTLCVSAIQQSPACQRMHYTFDASNLHDAVEHAPLECRWLPARFYDTDQHPWPIAKYQWDERTNMHVTVPVLESELTEHSTKLFTHDVLWIKKALYEACDLNTVTTPDYKTITITSALEVQPGKPPYYPNNVYNLFEAAIDFTGVAMWHGYGVIRSTPFNRFCLDNYCYVAPEHAKQQHVEEENALEYEDINQMYKPQVLAMHYHTDKLAEVLPVCYELNPFEFRNDPETDVPMPDDPATCNFLRDRFQKPSVRTALTDMDDNPFDDHPIASPPNGFEEAECTFQKAMGVENETPVAEWDYEPDDF